MKHRGIPISAKIAGLFALNLLVLIAAGILLLRQKWIVEAMPAFRSEKLDHLVGPITRQLEKAPLSGWDAILSAASKEHGVTFYLYSTRGPRLAGPGERLPAGIHSAAIIDRQRRRGPPPRPRAFGDERPPDEPKEAEASEPPAPIEQRQVVIARDGYWSFALGLINHPEQSGRVALISQSDSPTGGGFYSDTWPLYGIGGGLILLSVLVWWPFVRSATRSLRQMRHAAAKISRGDFSARVDVKRRDELGELGHSVNHMADQIGGLVDGQKRLLGDIAHELSSPIARMQAVVGILETLQSSSSGADRDRYIARLDDELQHMGQLVQELLSLSKASMKRAIELRPVALEPLLQRVIEREHQDGEAITLEAPAQLTVLSDPELLARAVGNVLRNAIRYAGKHGPVTVRCAREGQNVTIRVSDLGPGVPTAALPHLFDAFYRPDTARARETGGSGLGLAIAKTCVEATGGQIQAINRQGRGLEVLVTQEAA